MGGREEALWRRRLSRELAGLIALKLVALALLWWLFFSPAHRTAVDADITRHRLGMVATPLDPATAAPQSAQDASRD
jgi:hypothetical protein